MASKPMSQWDEHELFGEGYLAQRTRQAVEEVVESSSPGAKEGKGANKMENRLARPMYAANAPPLWRCNVKKRHYPEGVEVREITEKAPTVHPCFCKECLLKLYPYLEEGPVWVPEEHPHFKEQLEAEYVGMYEPAGYTELETPCTVCKKPIKLDGKTAAKFRENPEEAVHVACLGGEEAQALHAIDYVLPYFIRRKRDQQEECDGTEDEGEGGGPDGGGGP